MAILLAMLTRRGRKGFARKDGGEPALAAVFGRAGHNRHSSSDSLEDLAGHNAVGLRSLTTGVLAPFEFDLPDGRRRVDLPAPFSVTGAESFLDGVLLGLGLAQMPLFHVAQALRDGRLERVLEDYPLPEGPVSVLYPRNRQLAPRVRVFIDWVVGRFDRPGAELAPPAAT